jgi:hypothetical protein
MIDTKYIDETEFYLIQDEMRFCCDESQFRYTCKAHGEEMGCYFCEFDYSKPCDCEEYN